MTTGSSAKEYIVVRLATGQGRCKIVKADTIIAAVFSVVYGPDTKKNCEKWVAKNCS